MKKQSDINEFGKIDAQLDALHKEIGVLSKKKPEGGINPFKLKLANSVLEKANNILAEKYKPFSDFNFSTRMIFLQIVMLLWYCRNI